MAVLKAAGPLRIGHPSSSDPRCKFSASPHMLLLSYVSLRSLMFLHSNPTHRNINQQVSPPSFVSGQSLPVNGIWSRRVLLFQCVRFSACVALAKRTRLRARQSSQPSRQQSAIQTGPHSWPSFPALPLSRSRPGAHEGDPCPLRAGGGGGGGGERPQGSDVKLL